MRWLALAIFVLWGHSAWAQFSTVGNFTGASVDPGWTLSGSAALTAASGTDTVGNGWLRLTGNNNNDQGTALYTGGSFSAITGLTISFNYVSWTGGSPGADGISVFLFDATQNMSGAILGGGLGYCKGAGAYLGIGLDEYGNFSNGGDRCTTGGGPGAQPERLVLRGPTTNTVNPGVVNPFIANSAVTGNIDNPTALVRPALNKVLVTLTPSSPIGYSVTVAFSNVPGNAPAPIISNVLFPYPAPTSLSVGIAASTGGSKNIHEINSLVVSGNAPPQPYVTKSFTPSVITTGGTSTLLLNLFAANSTPLTATALLSRFVDTLPAGVTIASPNALLTNCPNTVTATAGTGSVSYATGSTVPANGCSIAVSVTSTTLGTVTNTVPAGALVTAQGSNAVAGTATLSVLPVAAPTLSKNFSPSSILAGTTSTLKLVLGNSNTRATSLNTGITDTLPAGLTVASPSALAVSGCTPASVTAAAGGGTIAYASGAALPAGGCTISVSVTGTTTGTFTNSLAASALQTPFGNNATAGTATLTVTGAALLSVSKTNGKSTLVAGSSTTYTMVVSNAGPSAADGTLILDQPTSGLNCLSGTLTCAAAGGAQCPATLNPQNFVQGGAPGTGLTIPKLPNGGSVTFNLICSVVATGQ